MMDDDDDNDNNNNKTTTSTSRDVQPMKSPSISRVVPRSRIRPFLFRLFRGRRFWPGSSNSARTSSSFLRVSFSGTYLTRPLSFQCPYLTRPLSVYNIDHRNSSAYQFDL